MHSRTGIPAEIIDTTSCCLDRRPAIGGTDRQRNEMAWRTEMAILSNAVRSLSAILGASRFDRHALLVSVLSLSLVVYLDQPSFYSQ